MRHELTSILKSILLALFLFLSACSDTEVSIQPTPTYLPSKTSTLNVTSSPSAETQTEAPLPDSSSSTQTATNIDSLQSGLYVVTVFDYGLRVKDLEGRIHFETPIIEDHAASISPNGRYIVYRGYNCSSLRILDLYSMTDKELQIEYDIAFGGTSWSPEGQKLVFGAMKDYLDDDEDWLSLFVMDLQTGEVEQVTFWPRSEGTPAWSPDGRWIAFTSDKHSEVPQPGENDIYVLDTACLDDPKECANHIRRLSFLSPEEKAHRPDWAIDSQTLAYSCDLASKTTLCLQNLDARAPTVFDESIENVTRPIWSPDGEWILFTQYAYRPSRRVIVINVDGSQQLQLSETEEEAIGWINVR